MAPGHRFPVEVGVDIVDWTHMEGRGLEVFGQ